MTMPINIYSKKSTDKIAWLCDDIWDLPNQIEELENWLTKNCKTLPKADYVIDIGFNIRPEANGGGSVISSTLMKLMADKGFDLYLSEYPCSE
jgi:hypothetical protein